MVQHFKQHLDYKFLKQIDGNGRILSDSEYECDFLKINVKDLFQQYVNSKILIADIINLIDEYVKYNKYQLLKQFIFNHQNQLNYYRLEFYQKYNYSLYVAIRYQDIESWECLWGLVFDHSSLLLDNVYYAAEFGNLKTFQHILYAYNNYPEYISYMSIKKLKDLALRNVDKNVKIFIDKLFEGISELLEDNNSFSGCYDEEIKDCQSLIDNASPNDSDYKFLQKNLEIVTLYFDNLNKFIHQ